MVHSVSWLPSYDPATLTFCGVITTHFKDVVPTTVPVDTGLGTCASEVGVGLGVSSRRPPCGAILIGYSILAEKCFDPVETV